MAPDPTEVPQEFAASFDPIPKAITIPMTEPTPTTHFKLLGLTKWSLYGAQVASAGFSSSRYLKKLVFSQS